MKIIFQVLVILVFATLIGGLMYAGVKASSSSSDAPSFEEGVRALPDESQFRPDGDRDERGDFDLPGGVVKALVLMSIAGGIYSGIVWVGKKAKRIVTT